MRYVPNLIPEKSKVLTDYFHGNIQKAFKQSELATIVGWIFGVFFLFSAILSIKHPILTILFGLIGIILLPPGHEIIETKLRFHLVPKIKTIILTILLFVSIPVTGLYNSIDTQDAKERADALAKVEKEKAEAEKVEQDRKIFFNSHLELIKNLESENKLEDAIQHLEDALSIALTVNEREQITKERVEVFKMRTLNSVKVGQYQTALLELDSLISFDVNNSVLLYNRAICYSRLGKNQEAFQDVKAAIQLGNKDAIALYDQINPVRQRVSYYVTRCCDGSTSGAKGRGACSRHSGVCNWNDPVYEEYREYK